MDYTNYTDLDLLEVAKTHNQKAMLALWERYRAFTDKAFYKGRELYESTNTLYEDWVQDAFIAFAHSIDRADLDKMRANGTKSFSTVYYFDLLKMWEKLRNKTEKLGYVACESELVREDEEEDKNSKWENALSVDGDAEIARSQAEIIIDKYLEEEQDPLYVKITNLLLAGYNPGNIVTIMEGEYTYHYMRKMIDTIKDRIKTLALREGYAF